MSSQLCRFILSVVPQIWLLTDSKYKNRYQNLHPTGFFSAKCSLCENFSFFTEHCDRQMPIFYLSQQLFICRNIFYPIATCFNHRQILVLWFILLWRIWGLSFIQNLNSTEFYPKPQNDKFLFWLMESSSSMYKSHCISNLISPVLTVRRHTEKKQVSLVGIIW